MKTLLQLILSALLCALPFTSRAADAKLTDLTEATSLAWSNLFYATIGTGSSDSRSINLSNVFESIKLLTTYTSPMTASNNLYSTETTRNAAVSNALFTLLVANDTTTSNGLLSVETTRNAAVSNALVTLLVANDTTTSNGLFSVETTRNAAVSNALVSLIAAAGSNYTLLNASRLIVTNHLDSLEVTYNGSTNIVIDWGATNAVNLSPSNTFTISMTGTPPTGMKREIDVLLINTNSSAGYFPTNDLNGGTVYLLPSPSTNRYKFNWRGGRFWISSAQQSEIGTNSYMRTRTGVRRTLVVPAGYIKTNTTQGAIAGTAETSTNKKQRDYLDFGDSANTNANFSFPMPQAWDRGNISVQIHWTASAGSGAVVWQVAADSADNDDTDDGAFGSDVNMVDTLTATGDYHISPASGAITFGNAPGAELCELSLRIRRDPGHASDTLGQTARLYYVVVQYTESIVEPAALP